MGATAKSPLFFSCRVSYGGLRMTAPGVHKPMTPLPAAADDSSRQQLQREFKAQLAAVTGGLAPEEYAQAWWDWLLRVSNEPGKQNSLMASAFKAAADNFEFMLKASSG